MINDIAAKGRKVVTIVDPHLKRDGSYNVHTEAQAAGVYVQNKDGGEFDGWCWPPHTNRTPSAVLSGLQTPQRNYGGGGGN